MSSKDEKSGPDFWRAAGWVINALLGIVLVIVGTIALRTMDHVDDHEKRLTVVESDNKHSTRDYEDLKKEMKDVGLKVDALRDELRKRP